MLPLDDISLTKFNDSIDRQLEVVSHALKTDIHAMCKRVARGAEPDVMFFELMAAIEALNSSMIRQGIDDESTAEAMTVFCRVGFLACYKHLLEMGHKFVNEKAKDN